MSWKLTQPNQSLPTFRNLNASAVVATIANSAGVSISAPSLNFQVAEEDVKQSNWWDPLLRIAEVACGNWVVRESSLILVPFKWTGETINFKPTSAEESINSHKNITGFVVNKRTSHYQSKEVSRYYSFDSPGYKIVELRAPINSAHAIDRSTIGTCTLIGFWNGHPNQGKSQMIGFQSMGDGDGAFLSTPIGGPGPATHMTLSVKEPSDPNLAAMGIAAKVEVAGSTPLTVPGADSLDLDLGFTVTVGTVTGPGARPGAVRNEALYPSAAYVAEKAQELLWEANKGNHTMSFAGYLDCTVRAGCRIRPVVEDTYSDSKAYSVTHSGSSGGLQTQITSYKIPW